MTTLFDPLTVGKYELNNRVVMAPLTRMRADADGVPTDIMVEYYAQRASAGLVVSEGTFPTLVSRGYMNEPGLATDEQAAGWGRVAEAVHKRGGLFFIQIMHAGRLVHPALTGGQQGEAPSAIASGEPIHIPGGKADTPEPRALELEDLPHVRDEFVAAARRAVDAGVDGVELHSANGYLLQQFLTPASNQRTDEYGGSPENRARFVIEVTRAVAEEIGADRVGIRISPQHNVQGAVEADHADAVATYEVLVDGIKDLGLAYLSMLYKDIDSPFVQDLRTRFGGPFMLNSGFSEHTDLEESEHIVQDNIADAVVVGRALIANPDLVERWRDGLELNKPDSKTFYGGGARGYTDYPFAKVAVQ
ncbi:alkene reductase [Kocuria sp. WRN011]|uniref:alkene reductase n=1 Tax=Kocuria TaxID=57493 RepID=UPI000BAE923A|nr:alkene reductase [Kocuria sp. WRN011]PBB08887.1 alkene reductase [Kocuria sp. WRN011]